MCAITISAHTKAIINHLFIKKEKKNIFHCSVWHLLFTYFDYCSILSDVLSLLLQPNKNENVTAIISKDIEKNKKNHKFQKTEIKANIYIRC